MTSGLQPINSGAPIPVQGVTGGPGLPQGVASVDGTTGNVVITPPNNTIQVRKTDSPQSFQLYEYFHTNTDFARISLNAQTGGPFQLAVETAPPSVIRELDIIADGAIKIEAGLAFSFGSSGGLQWTVESSTGHGSLIPNTSNSSDIGAAGNLIRTLYTSEITFGGVGTILSTPSGLTINNAANTAQLFSLTNTGALLAPGITPFVAGDHYVTIDAVGNLHRSAVGPAS